MSEHPYLDAYHAHVVRNSCCTGGRLCDFGLVRLLNARAEEARHRYLFEAANALYTCNGSRRYRERRWLEVDAASIAYDLAVAQACEERARRAVAW